MKNKKSLIKRLKFSMHGVMFKRVSRSRKLPHGLYASSKRMKGIELL